MISVDTSDDITVNMSLLLLPEEVLELIVKHLTVKDLIACSTVCLEWREKFNNNLFWKWFCYKHVKDYLEKTVCEVDPPFQPIQSNEERLEPVCDWRICYMRETHLINNWKSTNYSTTPVRDYKTVQLVEMGVDSIGTHWLFLWLYIDTNFLIEVWNVNKTPELVKTLMIFPGYVNPVIVAEGKLVVNQWNIITTYALEYHIETLFRCTLEEDKLLDSKLWESTVTSHIATLNDKEDFKCNNFGSLLVGHKRLQNPAVSDIPMHIWDLNSKTKLKTESMLKDFNNYIKIDYVNIFKIDKTQGIIRLVYLSFEDELNSILFVYDFKRLKFRDIKIECKSVVVWCGYAHNIIVTFSSDPGTIKFFDFSSGKLLSTKEIGLYANSEQMQLVDTYLLYCMFNSMYVVDILNQQIVYCVESTFSSFVSKLTVIEPRFVVVWLFERGERPGCSSSYQQVWDLKNLSRKLLQFSKELDNEMIARSPSLIKQAACYNGFIHVCTFW